MADLILIVEDEGDVLDLLSFTFKNAGFQVASAKDGEEAVRKVKRSPPSLILLDLMLPGLDGMEVCRTLKRDPHLSTIPIVMLTAKAEETDRIVGLELGADDYITKPFSPREVVLRVKSILRRTHHGVLNNKNLLQADDLVLDLAAHMVTLDGKRLDLTATEFKLLSVLLERRGRVQTRDRLLNDVWNYDADMDTRTVDTHMRRLREKIGSNAARRIETVRGIGYRFS